jgi:hypothetical protein
MRNRRKKKTLHNLSNQKREEEEEGTYQVFLFICFLIISIYQLQKTNFSLCGKKRKKKNEGSTFIYMR